MAHGPCHPRCRPCDHAAHAACVCGINRTARAARECKRVVTTMNRGVNPVIKRVVMTRQIYYQQYRCDSTRTTAQPAHDLSPPPRAAPPRTGLLRFSSLASQQGRVSRGALPVAGQRQRPAAPRRRRTPALTRSRSALPGCH